jgi:hypothetical protein
MKCVRCLDLVDRASFRTRPQTMALKAVLAWIRGCLFAARASRLESAYFVVARRGKAPPLLPPQHGGARFPTLAAVCGETDGLAVLM